MKFAKIVFITLQEVWVAKTFYRVLPTNIVGINILRKIAVHHIKSIAFEVVEAEEQDKWSCCNKYRPQKWPQEAVGTKGLMTHATSPVAKNHQCNPLVFIISIQWILFHQNSHHHIRTFKLFLLCFSFCKCLQMCTSAS